MNQLSDRSFTSLKDPRFKTTFWGYFFSAPRVKINVGAPGSGKTTESACAANIFVRLFKEGWVYWVLSTESKVEQFQKGLPKRMLATTDLLDPRITPPREAFDDDYTPHPKLVIIDEAGMELNQYHFGTDYDKMVTNWLKNHRHYDAWAILGDQELAISKGPREIGSGLVSFFAMTPMVVENVKSKGGDLYKSVLKNDTLFAELNGLGMETKTRLESGQHTGRIITLDFFTGKRWIVPIQRPAWFTKEKSHIGRYMSREDIISLSQPRTIETKLTDLTPWEETELHIVLIRIINDLSGGTLHRRPEFDFIEAQFYAETGRSPPSRDLIKQSLIMWLSKFSKEGGKPDADQRSQAQYLMKIAEEAQYLDKITTSNVQAIAIELFGTKLLQPDDRIVSALAKRLQGRLYKSS